MFYFISLILLGYICPVIGMILLMISVVIFIKYNIFIVIGLWLGYDGWRHRENEKLDKRRKVKNVVSQFKNSMNCFFHENYNPKKEDLPNIAKLIQILLR